MIIVSVSRDVRQLALSVSLSQRTGLSMHQSTRPQKETAMITLSLTLKGEESGMSRRKRRKNTEQTSQKRTEIPERSHYSPLSAYFGQIW